MSFIFDVIILSIPLLFFVYLVFFNKDKEENFAFFGFSVLLYLFMISFFVYKILAVLQGVL